MELNSMFQNLGPAGGAMLTGMQMADTEKAAAAEQQLRNAQMQEILQNVAQREQMNPLNIQAKKQDLAAADLRAKQEREAFRDEVLGKAIPTLEKTPAAARHAAMESIFSQAGLPLDQADKEHLYSLSPDELVKEMKAKHEWTVTQNAKYRQAMDVAREHGRSQIAIETARDTNRANLAKEKATQAATYDAQIAAAKGDTNKAAVARQWAMKAVDPLDRAEYERQAKIYDEAALARNPAQIRTEAEKQAMERLSGGKPTPKKEVTIQDMRDAL